ncbi:hypothetical protein CFP56_003406, partial [Quercus suber]
LLHLHLRNSYSENTILHTSLYVIHLSILRQPELPQELAATALHSMPLVHPVIFNLNLHFLLLKPRKISLENVGFWGLFPVDFGVDKSIIFRENSGKEAESEEANGKLLRWPPKKLGMIDILVREY